MHKASIGNVWDALIAKEMVAWSMYVLIAISSQNRTRYTKITKNAVSVQAQTRRLLLLHDQLFNHFPV